MVDGALLILVGLALLVGGAELVVRGATRLAVLLGVQPLIVGITIVAIGTSAPELAVGITAALQGNGGMAVGNIAGTNVLNILFILGLSALMKPLLLESQIIKLELPVTIMAALLMIALSWDGALSRVDGAILCSAGALYTMILIRKSRKELPAVREEFQKVFDADVPQRVQRLANSRPGYFVLLCLGLAVSVVGAKWLVAGAVLFARSFGFSDAMIGLTIIAVGTSAPELVTTIISTLRGNRDVAVGNLLGSSIYNVLLILGLTCLAAPVALPVDRDLLLIDIPLMVCVALACIPVFLSGRRISRLEGGLGVIIYLGYMAWLIASRT